jgi:serine/threonine protein kinase
MAETTGKDATSIPLKIANRYVVEKKLGQGGMAVVYQVFDTRTEKRLALKQLRPKATENKTREVIRLFEREFHTLTQLEHPHVVAVYEYGIDDTTPYYTMELLDGGDLRELAPLPWRRACSLIADVCSALCLIHSRRQIHRDVSPLNVRCTQDGKAKLIDFGAMVPEGPCKRIIGTPAFTAPEVVSLQLLDSRTDLYSLGTTMYYLLTNHLAYPGKSFDELHLFWRSKPAPPSTYVPELTNALDHLVLSLIDVEPMARPVSAAEVMERLCAIANLEGDDQLLISNAYLSTPLLVGRQPQIERFTRRISRVIDAHGGSQIIEGASGAGKSRLLNEFGLQAKLAGAMVLRADASDAYGGDWSAIQALTSQLLDQIPDIALAAATPYISVLGHVLPELAERFKYQCRRSLDSTGTGAARPDRPPDSDRAPELWVKGPSWRPPASDGLTSISLERFSGISELRPRVQAALRDWFRKIAERRAFMIALDDLHRIDEPSAAFVALISREISKARIWVVATLPIDVTGPLTPAINLLKHGSDMVILSPLNLEESEALLGSVFGEIPNIRFLASKLQQVAQGYPRAMMQLTQHLVDKGVVFYRAGSWTIPTRIDTGDLPEAMAEALKAFVHRLSPDALALARVMAFSPERRYSHEECCSLTEHGNRLRLAKALDELMVAKMLSTNGHFYSFNQPGWVYPLTDELTEGDKRAFHLKIAAILAPRGNQVLSVAKHLISAGQEERALEVFVQDFERKTRELDKSRKLALDANLQDLLLFPTEWIATLEFLLSLCDKLDKPVKHRFYLHNAFVTYSALTASADRIHYIKVIEQLYRDSGLETYYELGDSVDASDRLWRALEITQKRFDASPAFQRVLPPDEAIRLLARTYIVAMIYAASTFDQALLVALPSLRPLLPLSPALDIMQKNVRNTIDILTGRSERARLGFLEVLACIEKPDRAGLEESDYQGARLSVLYAIALIEASLGHRSALNRITEFDTKPLFEVNGWRVQLIYYLRQGNRRRALECKKRIEALQIQNSWTQFFEGTHVYSELLVYTASDDLVGVSQTMVALQTVATKYPAWEPVLRYARAEYQRIRGDYLSAIFEIDQALSLVTAGTHAVWSYLATCHILCLSELGRFSEAQRTGRIYVQAADDASLDLATNGIRRALAFAEAKAGDIATAIGLLELAIDHYTAADIFGITVGLVYETRARVAIMANDRESFQRFASLCARHYRAGNSPAITAKYAKLLQDGLRTNLTIFDKSPSVIEWSEASGTVVPDSLDNFCNFCRDETNRAAILLEYLTKQSNGSGGLLYVSRNGEMELLARTGNAEPWPGLDALVRERYSAELTDDAITVTEGELNAAVETKTVTAVWKAPDGGVYRPVVVGHWTGEVFEFTGIAVLLRNPGRSFLFSNSAVVAVSKLLVDAKATGQTGTRVAGLGIGRG